MPLVREGLRPPLGASTTPGLLRCGDITHGWLGFTWNVAAHSSALQPCSWTLGARASKCGGGRWGYLAVTRATDGARRRSATESSGPAHHDRVRGIAAAIPRTAHRKAPCQAAGCDPVRTRLTRVFDTAAGAGPQIDGKPGAIGASWRVRRRDRSRSPTTTRHPDECRGMEQQVWHDSAERELPAGWCRNTRNRR